MKLKMLKRLVTIVITCGVLANAQSPCCYPRQYEGVWTGSRVDYDESTGVAEESRTFRRVSVDYVDSNNPSYHSDLLITNLHTNVRRTPGTFLVDNNIAYRFNDTHCESEAFVRPEFIGCISDSAQFLGSSHIGEGDHKLRFHAWRLFLTKRNITVTVTDKCIPISLADSRQMGTTMYSTSTAFIGLTTGIKDRSIFDVPAHCITDL